VIGLQHLLWWVSKAIAMLSKPVVVTKQIAHSPMSTCEVISTRLLISMPSMLLMPLNAATYHIYFWTPVNTPRLLLCHPCPCCSFLFWIQSMRVYVVCRCSIVDVWIDSQAIHDWWFCYHCFKFQTNLCTQLIWPRKIFQRSNRIKYISMKKILLPLKVIGKVAIHPSPPRSIGISVMCCIWPIWYMINSHSWSSLLKYKEENLWEI